ncbi:MAG: glutamine--fructose-6-phosphate transaminase (isomerizing) [Alphaproteobacteria bacterium]|nr:glutamine--fructose-6-phosphate transaminase (isomerizing) [Alphaproteobacteria bacterium]
MCGIVGICGIQATQDRLIEGLSSLEYRGYDSAGIAVLNDDSQILTRKSVGKLANLKESLRQNAINDSGFVGIGHTRWATHGTATIENTHPHSTDQVAVVHNGIIENYQDLKQSLMEQGIVFSSDTDTEVVTHLLDQRLNQGLSPLEAVRQTLPLLKGAYALGILFKNHKNLLIGARHGSPLAIGYGKGEHYLGSDRLALASLTQRISYLDNGDIAVLQPEQATIYNKDGEIVVHKIHESEADAVRISKAPYPHFMLKEIFEQPEVIQQTLSKYFDTDDSHLNFPDFDLDIKAIQRITIVACGTAYYAGVVAKYWIESIARIPVEVDIASEFRYRQGPMPEKGIALFISQSGETADTLAALDYARSCNQYTIGIINVPESSLARGVHTVLHTHAGPEIGVASTKAFTTQLSVLAALTLELARLRGTINTEQLKSHRKSLAQVPALIQSILSDDRPYKEIAQKLKHARDVLYLGRGSSYPIAMEGALKLKEISYIHAEAYAAGEMKHGPIALIDENMPVVILAPEDDLFEKTISNLQEVAARRGQVLLFSDNINLNSDSISCIKMPTVDAFISPIIYTIPMQLLAYYTATLKGTDVDQPRNLAKSVTVE